jgi:hypothetical protein
LVIALRLDSQLLPCGIFLLADTSTKERISESLLELYFPAQEQVASLASRHEQMTVHGAFFLKDAYNEISSLSAQCKVGASLNNGGVTASTGLLVAERHAGVGTPVIAPKIISAEPQFALAA